MKTELSFREVLPEDADLIDLISDWYFEEWNIPKEYTRQRLARISNDDVIFHLILYKNNEPVATGGLFKKVGLLNAHPEFGKFSPWVALLYTSPEHRNSGYGEKLLRRIEDKSAEAGFKKIYLHTFTAEKLYLKNNWVPFDKAPYKKHYTTIMQKEL